MARILLVEDDPDVAGMMVEVLEIFDHEASHAADAQAALALVDAGLRPDLVLTDLMMPGDLDGVELAAALRARLPGLPVVVTTGHVASAETDAAHLPVLVKPFSPEQLEAAIAAALAPSR